jgi:hypothetical protein
MDLGFFPHEGYNACVYNVSKQRHAPTVDKWPFHSVVSSQVRPPHQGKTFPNKSNLAMGEH